MKRQSGFTLFEVIIVLVLVGILASVAGFGIVSGVRGYLMATENALITQKAQLAITRLTREFQQCGDCDRSTYDFPLTYRIYDVASETTLERQLNTSSNNLMLGPTDGTEILVDQVQSFSLNQEPNGIIIITLGVTHRFGGGVQEFQTRVLPRSTPR